MKNNSQQPEDWSARGREQDTPDNISSEVSAYKSNSPADTLKEEKE